MSSPEQRAAERAGRITVRRYASASEADSHELAYWAGLSDAERVLQVWRLSRELWELRGARVDESGLCRSVASLHRR
jgi:hypothetical protein